MTEQSFRIGHVLKDLYKALDNAAVRGLDGHTVSCKPACNACCTLLTMIALPEAILLAEALLANESALLDALPRLREQSLAMDKPGINKASWFARQSLCPVIDLRTGLCGAYEARPGCCRFHVSVSPPENCELGATDSIVASPDLSELQAEIWRLSSIYGEDIGMEWTSTVAPLPVSVLAVLRSMADSGEIRGGIAAAVQIAAAGVVGPDEWNHGHLAAAVAESDGLLGTGADAHRLKLAGLVQINRREK